MQASLFEAVFKSERPFVILLPHFLACTTIQKTNYLCKPIDITKNRDYNFSNMEAVYSYKSNWWGFVSKRLLIAVIAFFVISIVIFFLLILSSPNEVYPFLSPQHENSIIMDEHWLDKPLSAQYFQWIGDFFTGNWGESLTYPK